MSDDNLTKRQRQKLRREQRLANQRREQAKARRTRFALYTFAGLVVLGVIGFFVYDILEQRREEAAEAEEAAALLDDFGCSPDEEQPDLGAGHLETDAATLAQSPPEILYPDRPTTSGRHLPSVATTGVFDKVVDERLLVHNLEHGYIVYYYDEGAEEDAVEELAEFAEELIDDGLRKVIVAEWLDELPGEADFAAVAWNFRQVCEDFSPVIFRAFARAHHGGEGQAPEAFVDPHVDPDTGGVVDPESQEGPVLFPPLGGDFAGGGQPQPSPAPPGTEAGEQEAPEDAALEEEPEPVTSPPESPAS